MRLAWQLIELERQLPQNWTEAQLVLIVPERDAARAAALLGNVNPLRRGGSIRLYLSRTGGVGPEALRRALLRLDRQNIAGTLELVGTTEAEAPARAARASMADQWNAVVAALPPDWSDMLAELVLRSSDQLERAALLVAPLNPTRVGKELALRFRAAHRFGYGAAATMVRRCLERLDEEGIPAELTVLRVLCDSDAVGTQGPVWRVAGKPV
jgi:hypothetical protein